MHEMLYEDKVVWIKLDGIEGGNLELHVYVRLIFPWRTATYDTKWPITSLRIASGSLKEILT